MTRPRSLAGPARASPTRRRHDRRLKRSAGLPPALTLGEAYALLGLREGSAYDEVLAAKNRLLERHTDDFERRMQVGTRVLPPGPQPRR